MSASSLSRGPITDRLITELETEGFPVGDNAAPEAPYGWSGEPNAPHSTFTPWMVLGVGPGGPDSPQGAMGDTGQNWKLGYTVFYAGISRTQCEALADKMRAALTEIAREKVSTDTGQWQIMNVRCNAVGSCSRVGSALPDHFTESDSFEVRMTKG